MLAGNENIPRHAFIAFPFVENDPEIDRIDEEERIRSGIRSGSSLDRVAVSPFVYSLRPTTKTTGSPPLFPRRNRASSTLVHRRLTPATLFLLTNCFTTCASVHDQRVDSWIYRMVG